MTLGNGQRSLEETIREWRKSSDYNRLSYNTQKVYENAIKKAYKPLFRREFEDISQRDYAKAAAKISSTPSVVCALRCVHNSIQTWALRSGLVGNKVPFPFAPRAALVSRPWDPSALEAAISPPITIVRWTMFVGYHTAQRIGDILKLRWDQYDGTYLNLVQQKTGEEMKIPVSSKLKEELDARKPVAHTEFIIERYNQTRKTWGPVDYTLFSIEYRKEFPVKDYPPFHGIRHAAATKLATLGATAHEIQAITGHRSLASVQRYTTKANRLINATNIMSRF